MLKSQVVLHKRMTFVRHCLVALRNELQLRYYLGPLRVWTKVIDSEEAPLSVVAELAVTGKTDWMSKFHQIEREAIKWKAHTPSTA